MYDPARQRTEQLSKPTRIRARVTHTPPSEGSELWVVPWGYDETDPYRIEAGHWHARGSALPEAGTVCLVVWDAHGDGWVVAWEGVSVFPAGGGAGDLDGGDATSIYGGTSPIDGGGA